MISISARPSKIPIDETVKVILRFTNTGHGTCTNIYFTLQLPLGILLIRGDSKIKIPRLEAKKFVEYAIYLRAKKYGEFNLKSTNFSYRLPSGQSHRIPKVTIKLQTVASTIANPSIPTLELKIDTKRLDAEVWNSFSGKLTNSSQIPANDVVISIESQSLRKTYSEKIEGGDLFPNTSIPFVISVYPTEIGNRVPISINVYFKHNNGIKHCYTQRTYVHIAKIDKQQKGDTKMNEKEQIKILFLGANPKGTGKIRIDEEQRKIDDGLQAAKHRDNFELVSKWAVKIETLTKAMLDNDPQIVHFAGHGNEKGILLEQDDGTIHAVPVEALKRLFRLFKDKVECVVLNACYSEIQAKVISEHDIYVVGMTDSINDKAAIDFSVGFYQSVGSGKDYEFAYQMGVTLLMSKAKNISQADIPVLWKNGKQLEL